MNPNDRCYCGSGLKYKKCHRKKVESGGFFIPIDVPCVYKYFKDEKHADDLVDKGILLIGTLDYYRKMEAEDRARSDPTEGTKAVFVNDKRVYTETSQLPIQHQSVLQITAGILDNTGGHKISVSYTTPDLFIFCCSENLTEKNSDKYGLACVKIVNPTAFFSGVDHALRNKPDPVIKGGCVLNRCIYEDREVRHDLDRGTPPHFIKPKSYNQDHEIRAAWEPISLPIKEVFIQCLDIRKYCRRVK